MNKNKFKIKILYSFFLVSILLGNSIGTAHALFGGGPSVPSVEEVMNKVENQYGFDANILRRSQKKGDYPEVEMFFNKTSPKEGEKVTATALPKFFKNSNEDLYYTWFLFRDGDDLNDSEVMEDAKRRAMGIVARGDFDPFLFNTDYSNPNDDPDKDSFEASFGGNDGVGGRSITPSSVDTYEAQNYLDSSKQTVDLANITRCYRHNFGVSNPDEYSLSYPGGDLIVTCRHKFAEAKKGETFENPYDNTDEIECTDNYDIGDGDFDTNEEACWKLDPNNPDTDGDGVRDEADLAGLGQTQLTWTFNEGDRVGVIVEGTSMVATNEGSIDASLLTKTITFSCSNFPDGDYCVNSSSQIGECSDGDCTSISDCTGIDDETPCEVSGGGTGTCLDDSCQAVSSCSVNGNLCETSGVEGVCQDGSCVASRCYSSGTTCQTDRGTLGTCESSSCIENTVSNSDESLNPYYKIVWAGLDICDKEEVEGEDKRHLISDDECGGSSDYGFTYLATKAVFEKSEELLKSNLNFTPQAPQYDVDNNDYSSYITVTSNFTQSDIQDDFIYYDWDIYYCGTGNLETCTENPNNKLTTYCTDGDILGECSNGLVSSSYAEGLGLSSIKFKLDDDFLASKGEYDGFYVKAFLRTKKTKSANSVGVSSVDIPVVVNDNAIKLFKVSEQGNGDYGFSESADEICASGAYNKICPVFPGQIIAAKADIDVDGLGGSSAEAFSWEVNGEQLGAPKTGSSDCSFERGGCSLGETVYFPVSGSELDLQNITLKVKKDGGEEITSERIISATKPMAKIDSEDTSKAWPWVVDDGSENGKESDSVFVGRIGEKISFSAELVPGYLNEDLENNDISLTWYLNGQEIDSDFIADNSNSEIALNNQEIEFILSGKEGGSINLKVDVEKQFSSEEEALLSDNWDIDDLSTLSSVRSITIRQTNLASSEPIVKGNSVKVFMASTLNNAPEYFVFIIRTAIVFVLFWFFVFGFNYWIERELKIKK